MLANQVMPYPFSNADFGERIKNLIGGGTLRDLGISIFFPSLGSNQLFSWYVL